MRVVIAEDTVLLREGLAGLMQDAGHDVVAKVGSGDALIAVVAEHEPDLAVVDVRMPPNYRDEGLIAAATIRAHHPTTAVLVLSQHIETRYAIDLVTTGGGFGYLLKDRILDVDDFLDAANRVARGGTALDPDVVTALLHPRPTTPGPLETLTDRETQVLALMAEGRANSGIARRLWLSEKTVENHIRAIMTKLALYDSTDDNRRVLAVVTYLRAAPRPGR